MSEETKNIFDVKSDYFKKKYPVETIYGSPSRFNPVLIYVWEEMQEQNSILKRIEKLLSTALDIEEE